MKKYLLLFFSILVLSGCSTKVFYEVPYEFRKPERVDEFISKYTQYVKGKTFFLDPGHGGEDRYSVGVNELVTEADINLRVALRLREFLVKAGAVVIMSREKDETVDLKERSLMANRSGADIFISIHHNAPGDSMDNWTNYTSTYYHAKESDYEYDECEKDLAKFIQRDLAYAMRNSGGAGSFDGTYSDYNIYPKAGFSVLRVTEIPSVLVECGFFSNDYEEGKLAQEEYNKIEAWGIFKGICRYFSNSIPTVTFDKFSTDDSGRTTVSFRVRDPLIKIDSNSIKCYVDSLQVKDFTFKNNVIVLTIKNSDKDVYPVKISAANINGNRNLPFRKVINIRNKKIN